MNIAIILSGGSGTRLSSSTVKQLIDVNGKPLIFYSLNTFNDCYKIDKIIVVSRKEDIDIIKDVVKKNKLSKVFDVIEGGPSRFESSFNALKYLKGKIFNDDVILIHDAARPLVSEKIILENIKELEHGFGVITAIKSTDSIIVKDTYQNREEVYKIQTPQTFFYKDIFNAYCNAEKSNYTDDGSLMNLIGNKVKIVAGEEKNFKVTSELDLKLLKSIID